MGKISQLSANSAAIKICEPIQKEIDDKKKEIGEYVKKIITAETPDEVLKTYKKHPDWFKDTKGVNVQNHGFSYYNTQWVGAIPMKNSYSYEINKENSVGLHKLADQLTDLKKKHSQAIGDIENTLLALGTHKRVEEQYPEAYPYIADKPTTQALMINIAPVRAMTCALIPGCESKTEAGKATKSKTTKQS